MKKLNSNLLIHPIIFFTGFIISRFINIWYFEVDKNINIVDIASIITTIFVAYFIANKIEKENQDSKEEKIIIQNRIDESIKLIDEFKRGFIFNKEPLKREISYFEAVSNIRQIRLSFFEIRKIILGFTQIIFRIDTYSAISNDIKVVNNLVTDTSNLKNGDLLIKENIIYLTPERYSLVSTKLEELKTKAVIMKLEINRN